MHFGLDQAASVDTLEIRWPSGQVDTFHNLPVNKLYVIEEGAKAPKAVELIPAKVASR
ncbi:MAG TPA: ASPIC/UnbV domain-containing protein [Acidobacteriaceae bacterium]|nr:ASPIC/UnbV domain-containing protein [Acidobacteriaceae bacterium]